MATMTTTEYSLDVRIIDHVDNEGETCTWCQMDGATVQAQAYLPKGVLLSGMIECCLGCLIPTLDSTPYLDSGERIPVEVARSATSRPF